MKLSFNRQHRIASLSIALLVMLGNFPFAQTAAAQGQSSATSAAPSSRKTCSVAKKGITNKEKCCKKAGVIAKCEKTPEPPHASGQDSHSEIGHTETTHAEDHPENHVDGNGTHH